MLGSDALEDLVRLHATAQPAYLRFVDQHFTGLLDRAELLNLSRASLAVLHEQHRAIQ